MSDPTPILPWTTARLRTACETPAADCIAAYNDPHEFTTPDGEVDGINCDADLDGDQFCAAAYLAALESGLEFWPEHTIPSLCPAHWQLLLDRSARYDPRRALQNATAYAIALYGAVKNQMRRAARKSALQEP